MIGLSSKITHSHWLTLQFAYLTAFSCFEALKKCQQTNLFNWICLNKQNVQQIKLLREKNKKKAYGTRYSQAVTHLSTNRARHCLTSQIGRDGVCSVWYGRRRLWAFTSPYILITFFKTHISDLDMIILTLSYCLL